MTKKLIPKNRLHVRTEDFRFCFIWMYFIQGWFSVVFALCCPNLWLFSMWKRRDQQQVKRKECPWNLPFHLFCFIDVSNEIFSYHPTSHYLCSKIIWLRSPGQRRMVNSALEHSRHIPINNIQKCLLYSFLSTSFLTLFIYPAICFPIISLS